MESSSWTGTAEDNSRSLSQLFTDELTPIKTQANKEGTLTAEHSLQASPPDGGHADAVQLHAGIGSINIGVYRYSSPLSGFFPPWSLLGPGLTPHCYWPASTQSPAPSGVT
ncbi:hypothetical protein EYF80_001332 [Liparis tanakae]|uniref:Uncharacterized protein n=1 Tax=Liparis tanakae TaxID=230148 RepID=A0A4Z2JE86_9TELE|nr:hypothetical protein EYF80_001332 [Liparis tanakae]